MALFCTFRTLAVCASLAAVVFLAEEFRCSCTQPWPRVRASIFQNSPSHNAAQFLLFANNAAANATWRGMRVGPRDVLLMFNLPLPLDHLEAVPSEQKILFANADIIMRLRSQKDKVNILASAFERLVAINDDSQDRYITLRKENLPVFARFRDVQLLDRVAFIKGLQQRFPLYQPASGKRPSSGFLALHYALTYFPLHQPVLVGFTGEGVSRHSFDMEQHEFKRLGVTMI